MSLDGWPRLLALSVLEKLLKNFPSQMHGEKLQEALVISLRGAMSMVRWVLDTVVDVHDTVHGIFAVRVLCTGADMTSTETAEDYCHQKEIKYLHTGATSDLNHPTSCVCKPSS